MTMRDRVMLTGFGAGPVMDRRAGGTQQLPGCGCLGLKPPTRRFDRLRLQRKAGDELLADAKQRVDRAV